MVIENDDVGTYLMFSFHKYNVYIAMSYLLSNEVTGNLYFLLLIHIKWCVDKNETSKRSILYLVGESGVISADL